LGLFGRKPAATPRYFSACNFAPGPQGSGAAALDAEGRILWRLKTPARGHTMEIAPDGTLSALINRKPGAAITLCDPADGTIERRIPAPDGYSFDGHAIFSSDGTTLYATESRDGDQAGRIGVYHLLDGARIGEMSTHGIEPHELIWLERDRTLAVANGGIVDRQALQAEIESSLVILDAASGRIQTRIVLDEELNTLSIRHLALGASGEIVFAMQDQDAGTEWRPMVGIADAAGAVSFLELPQEALMRLRGYCGSAAVDRTGTIAAATSPHGGVAAFWHLPERRFLGLVELRDGCGIAAAERPGAFVFTSGSGTRLLAEATRDGVTSRVLQRPSDGLPLWDNHLTPAPV